MIRSVERREYTFKLIATLTILAGLLGFLAETTYREFFESIIRLAHSEEYNYIIVSSLTIIIVLYLALKRIDLSHGVRPSKVVFTVVLLLLSIATYSLAQLDLEFRVQLMGFSFVCILTALLLLIYEPSSVGEVLVFLTPLLLIPLPLRLIDPLTLVLSKYIGKLVGIVSRAKIIETPVSTQLEIISVTSEPVKFSVETACTSIVAVSSILIVIPLLLYTVAFSVDNPARKALISLFSLLAALLIGFLGSFIRVLIAVYAIARLSVEHVYTLLHYSPPALYTVISILTVSYIMRKYLKFKEHSPRNLLEDFSLKITWGRVAGILLLVVIIVSSVSLAVHTISSEVGVPNITINAPSISNFLQNPAKYISTSKVVFTSSEYNSFLTRILGALAVYKVIARSPEGLYTGYIELTDTPAKLHTWEFCLALQEYLVKASWSSSVSSVKVNFIAIERGNWRGVLAHTLFPVIVRTPSGEYSIYTRISLFSEEASNITGKLSSILLSVILEHSGERAGVGVIGFLNILSQSSIYILGVFLVYFVVVLIYKYRVRGVLLSGEYKARF